MPIPKIHAVATAVPPYRYTQAQILEAFGYGDLQRRGFFANSNIEGRYLYVAPEDARPDETVDDLAERFRRGALAIGEAAARLACERAGWRPEDLDFIATTTCTGRLTPSLDAHLIGLLGCRREIQRVHVGDTGCASAMVALQQAHNHLVASPDHRALIVSVEIWSAMMREMATALMATQGLKREDVRYWVLHSAGRRVIEQAQKQMELGPEQVSHSLEVLRTFGNMSSATILFVLERTLQTERPVPDDWGLMIGLGPGFAA